MKIWKYKCKEKFSVIIINILLRYCGIRMNFITDMCLNDKNLCLIGTIPVSYR